MKTLITFFRGMKLRRVGFLNFGLIMVALAFASVNLPAQMDWRDRHVETTSILIEVAHHDGLTVAAASRSSMGYIYTTTDVRSGEWTEYKFVEPEQLNRIPQGVTHFNGKWVFVEYSGMAGTTTDFQNWERVYVGAGILNGLRVLNNRVIALGTGGVAISEDGDSWEFHSVGASGEEFMDIAYGNGRYTLVGRAQGQGIMYTSTDAQNWTAIYTVSDSIDMIYSVDYGDDKFVAVGNRTLVMNSEDGLEWTTHAQASNLAFITLNSIRYINGKWLSGAATLRISSDDGEVFVRDNVPNTRMGNLYHAAEVEDLIVVTGSNGMVYTLGEAAEPPVFTVLPQPFTMTPGRTVWVSATAVGYPSDISFTWHWDGEAGEPRMISGGDPTGSIQITAPATSSTISVTAQSSGGSVNSGPIPINVVPTTDWEQSWTLHEGVLPKVPVAGSSAYGNGKMVYRWSDQPGATEPAGVIVSSDGLNWEVVQLLDQGNMGYLAFVNGRFIITTNDGYLRHSEDAINWSQPIGVITDGNEFSRAIDAISWVNGRYVVGRLGRIFVSTDLTQWEEVLGVGGANHFLKHNGVLHSIISNGVWKMTTDGLNWSDSYLVNPSQGLNHGVTYGNGLFVTSGNLAGNMFIATSTTGGEWDKLDLTPTSASSSTIRFTGEYFVMGNSLISQNGIDWIFTNTPTGNLLIGEGLLAIASQANIYLATVEVPFIFEGSINLGGGWRENPWLGMFNRANNEYAFHADFGWLYTGYDENSAAGAWIYVVPTQSWHWFSASVHGLISYDPVQGTWLFWNPLTGNWEGI